MKWLRFGIALLSWLTLSGWAVAADRALPKIAVTDLTYEEKVQHYFRSVSADFRQTRREGVRSGREQTDFLYDEREGVNISIDRGELHKFTADLKGELLQAGYRVVQGKPISNKDQDKLFDLLDRIKKGYYKGADYVLFGTISSIDVRDEATPVAGTTTYSHTVSLELVVEFSLVHTKTREVKAAFSAMGEGSDVRLQESAGARVVPSRGRMIAEVSKGLAQDAIRQLQAQLSGVPVQQGWSEPGVQERQAEQEQIFIYR
ncbi:LPS assembly lipoprotein LptE [Candidatus Magnetaquicoccus inordinatus]|uniref:LPS assembly lipoprotein LptE n=1 Tax=Candidatus Magnetaquicoccus inordinatus TaxID=2496818 RepID=UPI00102B53B4|nr:LPS assembly lipoprotein LptE [Candidatus Magnetaquicoccus inordinatus]